MGNKNIYLDHNATTPLKKEVVEAMNEYIDLPLNPSSIHSFGRTGKKLIESARTEIAKAIGADEKYQIIFTGSGTEANNIALKGFKDREVVTTTIEHPSVFNIVGVGLIPVDNEGVIILEDLEKVLAHLNRPVIISVMMANNEIGVIQPIKQIVDIARKYDALIHSDMTQAFGKIDINLAELDVDLATISAHKIGGPQGVGALIYKKNLPIQPLMQGGGQEYRMRPGTQNTIAIYGFGVAAKAIDVNRYNEISKIRDYLEAQIKSNSPKTIFFGQGALRLPNTSSFTMPGTTSETQLIHFDTKGFAVSAGSACSSGRVDLPRVHMSIGCEEPIARTAIRVSLGLENTKEDVDLFVKSWRDLLNQTMKAA